jgi:hypothetical protein
MMAFTGYKFQVFIVNIIQMNTLTTLLQFLELYKLIMLNLCLNNLWFGSRVPK